MDDVVEVQCLPQMILFRFLELYEMVQMEVNAQFMYMHHKNGSAQSENQIMFCSIRFHSTCKKGKLKFNVVNTFEELLSHITVSFTLWAVSGGRNR